jgi:hypothetical protein
MSKPRHNKKRNAGLLMEFLIRHISKCLINNMKEDANKAVTLSKRHFSKKNALHEELSLFGAILGTKVKSRQSAQKILSEVSKRASKMNARKLDTEKSRLIKEINHILGDEVYSYKVPNYTVYASIQTLFSDARNRKKLNPIERIKLEDTIVEHLIREETDQVADKLKTNPNYNNAVYKFVIERFHKKYADKLSENQKKLLTKYAVFMISENEGVIRSAVDKEITEVKRKLKHIRDKSLLDNSELMSKITECYKKIVTTDFSSINDQNILEVLKYMKLIEEVEGE